MITTITIIMSIIIMSIIIMSIIIIIMSIIIMSISSSCLSSSCLSSSSHTNHTFDRRHSLLLDIESELLEEGTARLSWHDVTQRIDGDEDATYRDEIGCYHLHHHRHHHHIIITTIIIIIIIILSSYIITCVGVYELLSVSLTQGL